MTTKELLEILGVASKLKTTYRHCFTAPERRESVAEHSWRVALWAMLLSSEPEFHDVDMMKVIRMALIHDLGEAFTGDIPSFNKGESEVDKEKELFLDWVQGFSEPTKSEWLKLLKEMERQETKEARLYMALDKMEAVLSHDESDINSWLPLEYDLQMLYGWEHVKHSETLIKIRKALDVMTQKKIENAKSAEKTV
ncbi:MAG: HD domain-containing protein [Thermoguttaceae bacterium]|jgi:putative hydrolase of HD superfamily